MAEYQAHYDNLAERQTIIQNYEGQGKAMLHDDFDPDWQPGQEPHGILIFIDPIPSPPPTPGQQLTAALNVECNGYHTLAVQAYNNWDSLTVAQKDRVLKFILGYYLSSGQRQGYFVL